MPGAFELGFTYGIADGLVGQLAMGQAGDRNDTKHGGRMTVRTTYLAPNLIYRLADTKLLLSAMAYYGSGRADVSRAYLNAGTAVISSGSPNAASMALRLRADMVDAFAVGPVLMTPYVSLTASRSTVDGYTEVGGDFPVQWNVNKANTKVARVGMDAVWPVNDKFNALARLEYARNLQTTAAPVSGQIIGLQPFAWSDHRYQRDWLRLGLGGQYKIDSSTSIRSTINVTTQSDAPKLWLNLTFNKAF